MRILCPTGHVSYVPMEPESFYRAMETKPDIVAADAGSDDIGPKAIGADTSVSRLIWQTFDLEHMLLASRRQGIPMIIGSAGDCGSNSRVDVFVSLIKQLAEKHRIPKFKLGYFYSEVSKDYLKNKLQSGSAITGLGGFSELTVEEIDMTTRIVAMAGVHPFIQLLDMRADVIIGGRCGDIAIFAAPAIRAGFPEGLAYHLGKMIECASLCAEPFMGKESVIGEISHEDIKLTPYHPGQRCTVASACSHSLYERANPFYEYAVGGMLDMTQCIYEQFDEKRARIAGAKWIPAKEIRVKLEGAKKVGVRYVGMVGIRDPDAIEHIDRIVQWSRDRVEARFGKRGYELYYHLYGKNAIMKELEPVKEIRAHELCVVVEGVAPSPEMAEEVTGLAQRQIAYMRIPEVKSTALAAAFLVDEPLSVGTAYTWSVNHTVQVDDPMELFHAHLTEAGV
jgi:hypothetical protein